MSLNSIMFLITILIVSSNEAFVKKESVSKIHMKELQCCSLMMDKNSTESSRVCSFLLIGDIISRKKLKFYMFMRQFDMNLLSILEDYQIILYKLLVRYLITYQINYQINFFLNHIAAIFFFLAQICKNYRSQLLFAEKCVIVTEEKFSRKLKN